MNSADKIRLEMVEKAIKGKPTDKLPSYRQLFAPWASSGKDYMWNTYCKKRPDGSIVYYEAWTPECWDAIYKQPQYKGMAKEEVIEHFTKNRLPSIAKAANLKVLSHDYGDKILYVKLGADMKKKEGKWATEFMEGYNKMGEVNFIDKRDRLIDGVSVNLSDYEKNDKVIKIWTLLSRYQGKGRGSKVLEKLKALADETKTSIVLKPGKWGMFSTLSVPELKEWYMRHGFKEMKNGWLIYKPKGVIVKVNLESHLGAGFWGKKAKRKKLSARAGRVK